MNEKIKRGDCVAVRTLCKKEHKGVVLRIIPELKYVVLFVYKPLLGNQIHFESSIERKVA